MPRTALSIGTAILAFICLLPQLLAEPRSFTESVRHLVKSNGLSQDWTRQEKLAEDYLEDLTTLSLLLAECRLESHPIPGANLVIDPWSLTLPSVPEITFTNLNYANGNPTLAPVPSKVSHAIPQIYHLAEYLGFGTNQLHLEVTRIDGKLFTSIGYGFHLSHRLRYDLVGTFFHHDSETQAETFRRTIESRGRTRTRRIEIGADVKPHKINLHYDDLEHETVKIHTDRPWNNETLYQQFPEAFQGTIPKPAVQAAEQALRAHLLSQIQDTFTHLRKQQVKNQLAAIKLAPFWPRLESSLTAMRKWEASSQHDHHCRIPTWSHQVPDHQWIEEQLQNQQTTSSPWELDERQLQSIHYQVAKALLHGLVHRLSGPEKILALEELVHLQAEHDPTR